MKKLILLTAFGILLGTSTAMAQDLKRPKDAGVAEYDKYKNDAFGAYEKSMKFRKMVENKEKFSLMDVEDAAKLGIAIVELNKSSKKMAEDAPKVKPKLKVPKVVKNTKDATQACVAAADNMKYINDNMLK